MSCQEQPWDFRLAPLLKRCAEIRDLNAALAVLGWDQQVYMPSGAAAGRAPARGAFCAPHRPAAPPPMIRICLLMG